MPTTKVKKHFTNREIADYIRDSVIYSTRAGPSAVFTWLNLYRRDSLNELAHVAFRKVLEYISAKDYPANRGFYLATLEEQELHLLFAAEAIDD
jgi:hypothetical protein